MKERLNRLYIAQENTLNMLKKIKDNNYRSYLLEELHELNDEIRDCEDTILYIKNN